MLILSSCRKLFTAALTLALLVSWSAHGQHFAAIGDFGHAGDPERDVAQLVKSWNPEFIITLGDNNYEEGAASTIDANIGQYYHEFIFPYRGQYGRGATINRFFPSLGNHDLASSQGQPHLTYFELPGQERYYDFVRGQVQFFVLNSNSSEPDGTSRTSRQAQWLKARLAASTSPWKVVYMHHPPYSSGSHGSSTALRWPYREWGASLVLSGHDHHYERLVVDGLLYCVNGLGGRSTYELSKPTAGSLLRYNEDYGAQLFDASADSLRWRFYTRAGQLIDSFTLRPGLSVEPQLLGVYPTPLLEISQIEFSLPADEAQVEVRVLDALGRVVATLHQGPLRAGRHQLRWTRGGLAPGTYLVQLRSGRYEPAMRTVAL
jgi:tartrate-resistant acid phosphatase type 5